MPPSGRAAAYRGCKRGFLLANYEQVLRDLPLMRRFAPGVVVLDEAQRIDLGVREAAFASYRLVLTGTPMENRLDELASLVEWVDDLALEPKWRLKRPLRQAEFLILMSLMTQQRVICNGLAQPNFEARIEGLVGNKKALFTGLFEGKSDEVEFEHSGSFLSRIERVLAPAG